MSKLGLLVLVLVSRNAIASPAACRKSPKDMTREAKIIVVAKPTSAKLETVATKKVHRGVYAVSSVIRGNKRMKTVAVETSCRNEEIPARELGYPGAQQYCPYHLDLPGFTSGVAKPVSSEAVVLFLSDKLEPIDETGYVSCDDTRWPDTTATTLALVKKLAGGR